VKRVRICVYIITIIVVFSISMLFVLKTYNEKLIEKIDSALLSWQNNEIETALNKVDDVNSYWETYYKGISFIIQSDKIEHLNSCIAKLKPLLETENDEFYAECESIKFGIRMILDSSIPKLHSVF